MENSTMSTTSSSVSVETATTVFIQDESGNMTQTLQFSVDDGNSDIPMSGDYEGEGDDISSMAHLVSASSSQIRPHFHIMERIKEEYSKRAPADVKLFTGDRFVRVHRSLLAAVSPLFQDLFRDLDPYQCKELDVLIPDIKYLDLKSLVEFLYKGEVTITRRRGRILQKWFREFNMHLILEEILPSTSSQTKKKGKGGTDHDSEVMEQDEEILEVDGDERENVQTETSAKNLQDPLLLTKCNLVVIEGTTPSSAQYLGKKLFCLPCDKTFRSESSLKSHNQLAHSDRHFNCSECGRFFKYKDTLTTHMREHTGEKLECDLCDKAFKHKRDLKDHMNIHTGESLYLCDTCPAKFDTKKKLYNHRESHRLNSEPCPICGKMLKNRASFKSHMKNHTTSPMHTCDLCNKSFKRGFDLKVHMRIHSGDKPYSCDICHKTFSLTSSLSKHKRFHQGATNVYTCPVCFEVLLAKEDLNVHLEVVHGAASNSNSSSSRNCTKSKGEEEYVITVEGSDATAAASGDIHQDPLGEEKHTIAFVSEEDGQVSVTLPQTLIVPDDSGGHTQESTKLEIENP